MVEPADCRLFFNSSEQIFLQKGEASFSDNDASHMLVTSDMHHHERGMRIKFDEDPAAALPTAATPCPVRAFAS